MTSLILIFYKSDEYSYPYFKVCYLKKFSFAAAAQKDSKFEKQDFEIFFFQFFNNNWDHS